MTATIRMGYGFHMIYTSGLRRTHGRRIPLKVGGGRARCPSSTGPFLTGGDACPPWNCACSLPSDYRLTLVKLRYILVNSRAVAPTGAAFRARVCKPGVALRSFRSPTRPDVIARDPDGRVLPRPPGWKAFRPWRRWCGTAHAVQG